MANPPEKYSGLYIRPSAPVRQPFTRRPIRYVPRGVWATPQRPFSQYRRPEPVDTFTTRQASPPRRIVIFWRAMLTSMVTEPRALGLVTRPPVLPGFLLVGGATVVAIVVTGATVAGGNVVVASVVGGEVVVGADEVGASVAGASVVGATVVGAAVDGGTTIGGIDPPVLCAHAAPSRPAPRVRPTTEKTLSVRSNEGKEENDRTGR